MFKLNHLIESIQDVLHLNNSSHLPRILAIISFIALTSALWSIRLKPLDGFELSVYSAHSLFWINIVICLGIVVFLVFSGRYRTNLLASIMGIIMIVLISGFPIFRGYHFYSLSDGFAHLGYVRDVGQHSVIGRTNLYPGMHLEAGTIKLITGLSSEMSLMLLVPVFVLLFAISVSITTRRLLNNKGAFAAGIVASLFIAPNMSAQNPLLEPTPSTIAVFFTTFTVLTLIFITEQWNGPRLALILISSVTLVLYHPMYAVAFSVTIFSMAIIIYALPTHFSLPHSQMFLILATVLGIFIYLLNIDKPGPQGAFLYIATALGEFGGADPAGIQTRSEGLEAVGASILEIAIKILTPKILLCLLAAAAVFGTEIYRIRHMEDWRLSLISVLGGSGAAVFAIIGIYLSISQLVQAVRYSAYFMVFTTILAAIAIAISKNSSRKLLNVGIAAILIISLIATVPVFFLSPYLYQESPNTPESEFAGYDTAFTYQDGSGVATTRGQAHRFWVGLYGDHAYRTIGPRSGSNDLANINADRGEAYHLPYHWNGEMPSEAIDSPAYIVVTDSARVIDVQLYDGLRFTNDELQLLESDSRVDKVIDTGGLEAYRTEPSE